MSDESKKDNSAIRWLDPAALRASFDPEAVRLSVSLKGEEEVPDARAVLAFPVSSPDELIDIRSPEGETVGTLRSLEGLDAETAGALRAAIKARYMIPRVERVLEIFEAAPFVLRWRVETDRGPRAFHTESPREAVKYQGPNRIRVTDLAGNHYDVRSISGLDPASRALLGAFL